MEAASRSDLMIPLALLAVDGPAVKAGYAHPGNAPTSAATVAAPTFLAVRAPDAKALAGTTSVRAVGPAREQAWLNVRSQGGKNRSH